MPQKIDFTEDQVRNILYLSETKTAKEIAAVYKIGATTVTRILAKNSANRPKRKYTLNEEYFNDIDTYNKAYILGFIYADGNVNKNGKCLSIEIQERDKELLELFKKEFQTNRPIYKRDNSIRGNGKWQDTYNLVVPCKKMVFDLNKWGVISNKSLKLEFPENLHKNFYSSFIRGYFDGDGTINLKKNGHLSISILGTLKFLTTIQLILKDCADMPINKIYSHGNVYVLNYGSNKNVNRFYNFIYENDSISLERKKIKFINFRINKCNKLIIGTNILTGELTEYESITQASNLLKIFRHTIYKSLKGKNIKQIFNFKYK